MKVKIIKILQATSYHRRQRDPVRMRDNLKPSKGAYLPVILVASTLFLAYAVAIVTISLANIKTAKVHNSKITSMSIAEAGINYYMWHLSHDNKDYCDGEVACTCDGQPCTGGPYGPYTHEFKDQYGNVLGTFELTITPPSSGGNSATVKSTGRVDGSTPKRTIVAEVGIPSFTKFTLLVNNIQLWLGSTETVTGSVHVNNSGMYVDGEITGDASSTETTYTGWFGPQPGVAGPGIFGGAKLFPVPAVDFAQLEVNMLNLRNSARDLGEGYFDDSGKKGYHIVLDENSYDLYKVFNFDNSGFDIKTETVIGIDYPYPSDGIIFFEDDLWVEGKIKNQRITIIAADPEANSSNQKKGMYVPNPILYTNYDGTDTIGLITQKNIFVTKNAPDTMEIDAAMIAKEGNIMIKPYGILKTKMTVYGSMAHNEGLIWTYGNVDTGVWYSGYVNTETIIDENNVLSPPPQFPTTGAYTILSWREE